MPRDFPVGRSCDYGIKKFPCIFMQGNFIFIQLLLAEGQEQNSDLTEVYIIFIQKSSFFIHPLVFPISDSFAGSPRGQAFLAFKRTGLRENFLPLLAERKNAGISRKPGYFAGAPRIVSDRAPQRLDYWELFS